MFHSLRSRLLIINLGLIILGFGSLTLWAGFQISQATWDDYGRSQVISTISLARRLEDPLEDNSPRVEAILRSSARDLNADLVLFDPNGNMLFTTNQPVDFIAGGTFIVRDGRVQSSAQITHDNFILGYVQVATSAAPIQSIINQRWLQFASAFLVFSLVGIVITMWLLNTLTSPLERLEHGALQIADGDLNHRLTDLPPNEIGAVGQAFNQMAERVSALIQEQRAFASNASHELRTPLTTIRLRTEAILDGIEPQIQQQYIGEIDSEARRLSKLVDDLLLLSRLDAQRLDGGSEEFDLVRLVQMVEREYASQANSKQISITLKTPNNPLILTASLTHAQVILRNVIDNAVKYSSENGCIAISVSEMDGYAKISVKDDGRGISAENLPHIGKRFYRTDKSRNRRTNGTGLGLALTESILHLYGGSLEIHSEGIDRGTEVIMLCPLVRNNESPTPNPLTNLAPTEAF
ncbi:MAG: ATP-binding protein [Ardenticatenaceae bacterium]|nr:ATP-binding protein [Ardenticatenaceae bacterium]